MPTGPTKITTKYRNTCVFFFFYLSYVSSAHRHTAIFQRGFDMLRAPVFTKTLPTIVGSPWQVSQGSSALSFIANIIRCTFNKPWSQIGILGYAPMHNGGIGEHCLWLCRSQIKVLKPSMFAKVKYQQKHITQGQKFIALPSSANFLFIFLRVRQQRQQAAEFPQIPLRYEWWGSAFCFGRDYQSAVVACVHPLMHRLLRTLNYWVPPAAHLSRQTN